MANQIKKSLALLAVLAVVLFGIGAGLAIVPHSHGNDYDHSQHKDCPVYQISLHSTEFTFAEAAGLVLLFSIFLLLVETSEKFTSNSLYYFHLRAPPSAFRF